MLEVSDEEIGNSLLSEINSVRDLTNSAPRKYDALKRAFFRQTGARVAVCYLSDMSKMWTPRVGQALLGRPDGLIVLSSDSFSQRSQDGEAYLDKLEKILLWAPRIELAVACIGWEGDWAVECIVGPSDSLVCDWVAHMFPDAAQRRFEVSPITRLPDPR
jgi:hypothetical protein